MSDSNYDYIDTTGTIVPDTSTLLTQTQTIFTNAFGSDLIVDASTPQGVIITAITQAFSALVTNNAALANQINPNLAAGVFLDAICALTGLQRVASTPTTVTATLSGVPSTNIPAGSRAQTAAGDVFATTASFTIGGGGTVSATFQAQVTGPVPCGAGALTQIVDGIIGWETVYNSSAGVVGQSVQSDQSLRALRKVTLALQSVALPDAIISGLYNTEGVTSLTFLENIAATTQTIQGISMVAHSIYVCVEGGTNLAVATSLLSNKSLGAAWNGGTSVVVVDSASGQSYTVLFDRPTAVPIYVKATVSTTNLLVDATTATVQAILDYANGNIAGEPGLIVGQNVSCFELAGAVTGEQPTIYVSNMQTSTDGITYANTEIDIAVNQIATIIAGNITVVIT
jgi:uncharacterized phage protein gp47/JayE